MPAVTTSASDSMELTKMGIQAVGYVVTWVIVLIGWGVSNRQNRDRDDRKEMRDHVSSLADSIREVEANVVSYLTDVEGRSASSYWTVHFGVRQVNLMVVSYANFNTGELQKLLRIYRQAITDTAMPGPSTKSPTGAKLDTTLRTVAAAGNGLVRGLESRYRELYPHRLHTK
jgi:hypothetical protein